MSKPFLTTSASDDTPPLQGIVQGDIATLPPARNISQHIARRILYHWGWKLYGNLPRDRGFIFIAAPHTSNWDFVFAMLTIWGLGLDANWLGKASLFRPPFGWIMRLWRGIPVDRSQRNSLVDQIAQRFAEKPTMRLLITPEGTRSHTTHWRTGFYHMAVGIGVPIALGHIDGASKIVGFSAMFYPSGNIEDDFALLAEFYADKRGLHPEKAGQVRLKPTK